MNNFFKQPLNWAWAYLLTIVVFAVFYLFVPDKWGGCEPISGITDSLYFSVVTITTLGFGDTYPVSGSPVRILVMTEVILGILFIGFFLNDMALAQSKLIDKKNKDRAELFRKNSATEKLKKFNHILTPMMEKYLRGVYEVITPLDKRGKDFPSNIFEYTFEFDFNNMYDLYSRSLLMTNDSEEPVLFAHFRNQDDMYEELRYFTANADLSDWPDLEESVYLFIARHREFMFKDALISYYNKFTKSDNKRLTVSISKFIKEHDGDLKFRESNLMTPYEVFYVFLKDNIQTIIKIKKMMNDICDKSTHNTE